MRGVCAYVHCRLTTKKNRKRAKTTRWNQRRWPSLAGASAPNRAPGPAVKGPAACGLPGEPLSNGLQERVGYNACMISALASSSASTGDATRGAPAWFLKGASVVYSRCLLVSTACGQTRRRDSLLLSRKLFFVCIEAVALHGCVSFLLVLSRIWP